MSQRAEHLFMSRVNKSKIAKNDKKQKDITYYNFWNIYIPGQNANCFKMFVLWQYKTCPKLFKNISDTFLTRFKFPVWNWSVMFPEKNCQKSFLIIVLVFSREENAMSIFFGTLKKIGINGETFQFMHERFQKGFL